MAVGIRRVGSNYGAVTGYSFTATINSGEGPGVIVVFVFGGGTSSNAHACGCTIGGVSANVLRRQNTAGVDHSVLYSNPLPEGSYTVSITGLSSGWQTSYYCDVVTQTSGPVVGNFNYNYVTAQTEATCTVNMQAGQLRYEYYGGRNNYPPAARSSQVSLGSLNYDAYYGITYYKQNVGTGNVQTGLWMTDTSFWGVVEFLPSGKIFDVVPAMIG